MSSYTISFRVKIAGVLTDADSTPILRDEAGTYGIREVESGDVVIGLTPSPTQLTRVSAGVYTYTLDPVEEGVVYQYAIEAVVDGVTYRKTDTFSLSTTGTDLDVDPPPTDDEITEQLRRNLANPLTAMADGQSATQHNLKDQIAAAEYLKRQQAAAAGPLGGFKIMKILGPGME